MANIDITTCDTGVVTFVDNAFEDDALLFAAADTYVAGTILARKLVSDTITSTVTGTGTRTRAPAAIAGRTLLTGTYTVVAGDLTAGVGPFTCTAPDGMTETITVGTAGGDWTFTHLGLYVDIGAGTEFADNDSIGIVVSAQSGTPMVPYSPTGRNGAQVPAAVLTYAVTATSGGSVAGRVCVSGQIKRDRLIIDEDGTGANVTLAVCDALRRVGITPVTVTQLADLDNGAT